MVEKLNFNKGNRARTIFRIFNYFIMVVLVVVTFIPLLKVFVDSIDLSAEYGINLWPKEPSLLAYRVIVGTVTLYKPFFVSLYTTVIGTFLGLLITTLGAYVLIQRDLIGRKFFSDFIFFTMIFSGGLIPMFMLLKGLGMLDNLSAVLIPSALNVYNMVLMKNFFDGIPVSLFESADIDGCTPMHTFVKIVLPLSLPALSSIGLFFAVSYWNEFFNYVMYITNRDLYNFQVRLREIIINDQTLQDAAVAGHGTMVKNAAVIVAMLPFMILYPFCQRYFITGVTMGAVKE